MERNEFLGKRVKLIPNKDLDEDYHGLTGTIIRYSSERHVPIDKNSEATKQAKVLELWQVRFDYEQARWTAKEIENKQLLDSLRVCRDMFEVIGDSEDSDLHRNVDVVINEEQSIV
jgi:hypothetical protein